MTTSPTLRLAVTVASDQAPPTALAPLRGFETSIRRAADLGYQGVELALRSAEEIDPAQLRRWLSAARLEVSCITTGQVFAVDGLSFTHRQAAIRDRAVEVFAGFIELAREFGGLINVGRTRGPIADRQRREQAEDLFIDVARRICDLAARRNVTLLIEPVNRYELNFINTLDEAAALLARVQRRNLGLMPDVFHMNIEEATLGATLARHRGLVRYIHLADSNRLAPGQGHLDFEDVFQGLRAAGFNGWAAIEILPRPNPETAVRQAAEAVLPWLARYNSGAAWRITRPEPVY
jgi:5-keto-L-gluconate epimerase